jgi:hypothetical protein
MLPRSRLPIRSIGIWLAMVKPQVYRDNEEAVKAFVKERDEVLLRADLDEVIAFQRKHDPDIESLRTMPRLYQEAGMHKAITAVKTLPREHRMKSKRWLVERGYSSFDDRDLNDA